MGLGGLVLELVLVYDKTKGPFGVIVIKRTKNESLPNTRDMICNSAKISQKTKIAKFSHSKDQI